MKKIGQYTLDSLQIFFPWDEDLYTHMQENGFGRTGFSQKIPIIYSDDCLSTSGNLKTSRNHLMTPSEFGMSCKKMGWTEIKERGKKDKILIPPEKSKLSILKDNDSLVFNIIPNSRRYLVKQKEEYHIEYRWGSLGYRNLNWAIVYFCRNEYNKLLNDLSNHYEFMDDPSLIINKEKQIKSREEMKYIGIPINYYEFSLGGFKYAENHIKKNGYTPKQIPSLIYNKNNQGHTSLISPIAKLGAVKTTPEQGMQQRPIQFTIKIAQTRVKPSERDKLAKKKGIIENANNKNTFVLDGNTFANAVSKLNPLINQEDTSL